MSYVAGELRPFPVVWLCSVVSELGRPLLPGALYIMIMHFGKAIPTQACTGSPALTDAMKTAYLDEKESSLVQKSSNSPLCRTQHRVTNVLHQGY